LLRQSEGIFVRSSDGSQLMTYHASTDPNSQVRYSSLTLAENKSIYLLNHGSRTAILKQRLTGEFPRRLERPPQSRIRGTDTSTGLACTLVIGIDNKTRSCNAYDYDLRVRMESRHPKTPTKDSLTVMELFDIQLGQEPDAELLRIPKGYQVLEPAQ
jgi:hypothetical protein